MTDYLIWSIEHTAWWKPGKCGYARELSGAGVYNEAEAREIVKSANIRTFNECMIPLDSLGPDRTQRRFTEP